MTISKKRFSGRLAAIAMSFALITTLAPQALADDELDPTPTESASPSAEPEAEATCVVTASSADVKAAGAATNMWGSATDCAAGTLVAEANVNGTWTSVGTVRHSGNGGYVVPLTGATDAAGTYELRAVLDGTASNAATLQRLGTPTVASAGTKLVGLTTNTWGRFDTDRAIEVWTEVRVGSNWSRSQTRQTTANGNYVIPLTYGANAAGTYSYRVAGRYADGTVVRTSAFELRRLAAPTAHSAGEKNVGEATNAWGRFDGGAGIRVWTEAYVGGRWSTSQTGRADANGNYVLPLTYGSNTAGTYRFRVAGQYADGTIARSAEVRLIRVDARADIDRRCLTGRVMCASKTTNKLHWMIDGKIIESVDVRYGRPGLETREGVFSVGWKSRHHVSSIYGTAMPYAMFFSGGQAVHYSSDFARRGWVGGSGGCINVRDEAAIARIYSQVRVGDKVVVHW